MTSRRTITFARRALILWRAWRARKAIGPQIDALRQSIATARKNHRPVAHLTRRLREANHARLRAELGVK